MEKIIHCCGCGKLTKPRLTDGREIYPHRPDLASLPFWKCDACGNFVGCHHKTKDRTRQLGSIPTPKIRELRKELHSRIDPLWKTGKCQRGKLYAHLSKATGKEYHTAEVNTVEEANAVIAALATFSPNTKG